jgi:signal peptidase I
MRKCKGHPKGFVLVRDRLKKNITMIIKDRGDTMKTKEGDIFKRGLDGEEYTIKRIVNRMVVLESKDGKRQVLTEIDNLQLKPFYQKQGILEH